MFPYIFLACILFPIHLISAGSGAIVRPHIYSPTIELYVSPEGVDKENSIANADNPLQTFDSIFSVLKQKTIGMKGNVYCAVLIRKGIYRLNSPIDQAETDFIIAGGDARKLHVSFIGLEDSVIIDGTNCKKSGGYGLLRVCGSNIIMKNLIIKHAPSFGMMIGQPFARSTNVFIENIHIDSSFSHGLVIGDVNSAFEDTILISKCRFTETNQMNANASSNQWGSALKLFGASHIMVDSCHFEHNWSEAISINDSKQVKIIRSSFVNNYAPSVYCDIAQNVTIEQNLFTAISDTVMYKAGKRGMVAILLSNEAWNPAATHHRTSDIDIFSNVFIGQSGVIDMWEGTVSFLQTSTIENVRCAFNSSFGMSAANYSTNTGIISTVFSTPMPFNRTVRNILVYGNIFSVDPNKWPTNTWFRADPMLIQQFTFRGNRWNSAFPKIGEYVNDDYRILSDTYTTDIAQQADFRKRIASLKDCEWDMTGKKRGADSTFAGAFEYNELVSVSEDSNERLQYIYSYFPNAKCLIPKDWKCREILCIGLKGEMWTLQYTETDGVVELPGNGPYFLCPLANNH